MINKALKLTRQFHSLKQIELAEKLGISKSYLSEIESGKKPVSYELLEKYSDIFEIKTSSLVFFSESLNSKDKLSERFRSALAGKIIDIMEWAVEGDDKDRKAQATNQNS